MPVMIVMPYHWTIYHILVHQQYRPILTLLKTLHWKVWWELKTRVPLHWRQQCAQKNSPLRLRKVSSLLYDPPLYDGIATTAAKCCVNRLKTISELFSFIISRWKPITFPLTADNSVLPPLLSERICCSFLQVEHLSLAPHTYLTIIHLRRL
jgi:hypothetical protein